MASVVVCDSSTLISLTATCNVDALAFLKAETGVRFVATPGVYSECVDVPLNIRKYESSAVKIRKAFRDGVVEEQQPGGLMDDARAIMQAGNSLFTVSGKPLELIQEGEVECLALLLKNDTNYLAIDEKTLRLLIEDPLALRKRLQEEYAERVVVDEARLEEWRKRARGILVVRSTEVLAQAAKKGYFAKYGEDAGLAFKAAIYSLRQAGCSLTEQEIREYGQL